MRLLYIYTILEETGTGKDNTGIFGEETGKFPLAKFANYVNQHIFRKMHKYSGYNNTPVEITLAKGFTI